MRRKAVDTPQYRRDVERLVRNVYPGCRVAFVSDERGALAFRVVDERGRVRSDLVKVYDWHRQRFTKSWLAGAVGGAATSKPGLKRLLTAE